MRSQPLSDPNQRFQIHRLLGRGSSKSVHLATDLKLEREVAIARLIRAGDAHKIFGEAVALARLSEHPHIVTIYDIIEWEGPCIVMQYMSGGDLRSLFRRLTTPEARLQATAKLGPQIARAIAHIHANEFVHRDLKPENIFLDSANNAYVGDFSLATRVDSNAMHASFAGTLGYLPKDALSDGTSSTTDMYALGCVLHELLVGSPPYRNDELLSVLSGDSTPVPAIQSVREIPLSLKRTVTALLSHAPQRRPSDASLLAEQLGIETFGTIEGGVTRRSNSMRPTKLIGRGAETRTLLARMSKSQVQGTGTLISGPAGIGKSSLAMNALLSPRFALTPIFIGSAKDNTSAFEPWHTVLNAVRQRFSIELPAVSTDVAHIGAASGAESANGALRTRLAREFEILEVASRRSPLVLLIEDVHLLQETARAFLLYVLQRIPDTRIALVFTERSSEGRATHEYSKFSTQEIALSGLGHQQTERLLRNHALQDVTDEIQAITRGNPLYVQQAIRGLRSLGRDPAKTRLEQLPTSIVEIIEQRFRALTTLAKDAASAAAVIGTSFSLSRGAELSAMSRGEFSKALDELERFELMSPDRYSAGSYSFVHAIVQRAIYALIDPSDRAALHLAAGHLFEGDVFFDAAVAAHHYRCSEEPKVSVNIARLSIRAAAQATERAAFPEAVRHFDHAIQAMKSSPGTNKRTIIETILQRAEAEFQCGESATTLDLFREVLSSSVENNWPDLYARAALGVSGTSPIQGPTAREIGELLDRALELLRNHGLSFRSLRARVLARLASVPRSRSISRQHARMALRYCTRERLSDVIPYALVGCYDAFTGGGLSIRRMRFASLIVSIGAQRGDPQLQLLGYERAIRSSMEVGLDLKWRSDVARYTQLAELSKQPIYLWRAHRLAVLVAVYDGDFDRAKASMRAASAIGSNISRVEAEVVSGTQAFLLNWLQHGLTDRMYPAIASAVASQPERYSLRCWHALALAIKGDTERSRIEIASLVRSARDELPTSTDEIPSLVALAQAVAIAGASAECSAVHDLLIAHSGCHFVLGSTAYYGPVDYYISLVSLGFRPKEEAIEMVERAVAQAERTGSQMFALIARWTQTRMLSALLGIEREETVTEIKNVATSIGMRNIAAACVVDSVLVRRSIDVAPGSGLV